MPAVAGSSRFRIAACAPAAAGLTLTVRLTGEPFGRAIEPAVENVPSLPTQLRLYLVVPPPPPVRRNVYWRVYEVPMVTPSRSWMPTPMPGVARKALNRVLTATDELISAVFMLVFSRFQAAPTFISPLPWS